MLKQVKLIFLFVLTILVSSCGIVGDVLSRGVQADH